MWQALATALAGIRHNCWVDYISEIWLIDDYACFSFYCFLPLALHSVEVCACDLKVYYNYMAVYTKEYDRGLRGFVQ